MTRVLVYLGRFALILFAYAVAALAASTFLHIVSLGALGFTADQAPAVVMGSIVFSIPFVALFVAYFAFLPSLPAILLSEILGKRDWLYYAIAGAVVASVVVAFFRSAAGSGNEVVTDPRLALGLIGAGMCGGIAYWLVAGRFAGNWRGKAQLFGDGRSRASIGRPAPIARCRPLPGLCLRPRPGPAARTARPTTPNGSVRARR